MKTTGIIAEYNPFHAGHEYQLTYTREKLGADFVIVAMSGDYVQRGAPALLPKHVRAEMALRCGADLVLELPVSVSTASAEFFAAGGVSLLDGLGVVDTLCFGSEAGEVEFLQKLAGILVNEPDEYKIRLQTYLRWGVSYPAARSRALAEYCETEQIFTRHCKNEQAWAEHSEAEQAKQILSSPNNILGLEYCKALHKLGSQIQPVTLLRRGSGYHDESSTPGEFPSATSIRQTISQGLGEKEKCFDGQIPAPARKLLEEAVSAGAFVTEDDLSVLLHYCLLSENLESLCTYLDMTESLARRILKERSRFVDFRQFAGLLKTKDITQTRIQRALLHMLLHIHEVPMKTPTPKSIEMPTTTSTEMLTEIPTTTSIEMSTGIPYARVLGFRRSSTPLLKEIKARGRIPLITKIADAPGLIDEKGMKLLDETTYASNVYESILCRKTGRGFIHEYEKRLVIV